jgi:ABC-type amino acid transport substrate-binding protein
MINVTERYSFKHLIAAVSFAILFFIVFVSQSHADDIMKKIETNGVIRIGFQEDVAPFAWFDEHRGSHHGFSVEMANQLVMYLSKRFNKPIRLQPVNLNASQRIDMVTGGEVDIEMGASTQTCNREKQVDFSLVFFPSETTFMVNVNSGIQYLKSLNGKLIAAGKGTTNLYLLKQMQRSRDFADIKISIFATHNLAMQALLQKQVDAYCADRVLLTNQRMKTPQPQTWTILEDSIGYEPYAFMIPEGNSDFRDFVNDTIRWTIHSGTYFDIYEKWMGPSGHSPYKMPFSFKEYLTVIAYPMDDDWWRD